MTSAQCVQQRPSIRHRSDEVDAILIDAGAIR